MRSWFLKRKYPEKLIDNEMKKVRFFPANLQNKKREVFYSYSKLFLTVSARSFETRGISLI